MTEITQASYKLNSNFKIASYVGIVSSHFQASAMDYLWSPAHMRDNGSILNHNVRLSVILLNALLILIISVLLLLAAWFSSMMALFDWFPRLRALPCMCKWADEAAANEMKARSFVSLYILWSLLFSFFFRA